MSWNNAGVNSDFDFTELEAMIHSRGNQALHEISLSCPCIITETANGAVGQAKPECSLCLGRGVIFRDPVMITAIFENMMFNRSYMEVGWVKPSDLQMTPSIHARSITNFDRITLKTPIPTDASVMVRGQSSAFNARPDGLDSNEDYLYWEAGEEQAIWLEDENGVVYKVGDYLLQGRKVVWNEGAGPSVGTKYTIKYKAYPEYIAWTTPIDVYEGNRTIGQRVVLRKNTIKSKVRQIEEPWKEKLREAQNGMYPQQRVDSENTSLDAQR
jgi:hypothetical protein